MVRSFLLLAAVSVTSLLLHAAAQPETFFVQRTASIDAPPEAIHSMIDDLRRFNAWNPYGKKDPNNTFEFTLVPRGGSTDVTWAM